MAFLFHRYMHCLHKYPIITKSTTAGILMTAGDYIAQRIEYNQEEKKIFKYDKIRGVQMGVLGTFLVGPLFHRWFIVLDKIVPAPGIKGAVGKVVVDQLVMAPSFLAIFYTYMGIVSNYSLSETYERMFKPHYFESLRTNYKLWPTAQFINIYFIPMHLRVLWLNCIGLLFNIYLSHRSHMHTDADNVNNNSKKKDDNVVMVEINK